MVKVEVKATSNLSSLSKALRKLANKEVLVGIAENASSREADDSINNAELLYIHSHGIRKTKMREEMQQSIKEGASYSEAHALYLHSNGSPLWHAPPRPVLEPAIEDSKESIAQKLQEAVKSALDGNSVQAEANMQLAGMLAAEASKGWFENPKNNWEPNSPKTIRKKGSDLPLVDTNAMRKAINYFVRDKK
ncbi:MAG: hypothetical protein ACI3ZR_09050 [bacterium]